MLHTTQKETREVLPVKKNKMKQSLFFTVDASILCLLLFGACILMVIIGKRARDKFLKKDEQELKVE
jgi:hypothetical protein